VACGTGKLTADLAAAVGPEGRVVGVDLSPGMLDEARRAFGSLPGVEFVLGNALALPVADASFDAATIAFGLRNLSSFEDGFREMARAVRSGGRVVCLELSVPRPRFMGSVYRGIFRISGSRRGSVFRRRAAYSYLPHSLDGFPAAEEIAETMRRAGLEDVSFKRLRTRRCGAARRNGCLGARGWRRNGRLASSSCPGVRLLRVGRSRLRPEPRGSCRPHSCRGG
jgi:demethylmenaquinone methyltransferase/2-methoxy-6-polyprenyl-1,4-benzoquinol methylase